VVARSCAEWDDDGQRSDDSENEATTAPAPQRVCLPAVLALYCVGTSVAVAWRNFIARSTASHSEDCLSCSRLVASLSLSAVHFCAGCSSLRKLVRGLRANLTQTGQDP